MEKCICDINTHSLNTKVLYFQVPDHAQLSELVSLVECAYDPFALDAETDRPPEDDVPRAPFVPLPVHCTGTQDSYEPHSLIGTPNSWTPKLYILTAEIWTPEI